MFGALFIPEFPLQAALSEHPHPPSQPVAVLDAAGERGSAARSASGGGRDKALIIGRNAVAIQSGVEAGAGATQGLARCPRLVLLPRCREEEARLQGKLLDCAQGLSPDCEDTAEGTVLVDLLGIRGGTAAFGGAALRRVTTLLHGIDVRIGMAAVPDLARLAARVSSAESPVCDLTGPASPARFLAPLPVAVLSPGREVVEVLAGWGVGTLGELAALPRDAVVERLGAGTEWLHELASGCGRRRLLRLVRPPREYARQIEPDHEIETLEPLLFLVRRLLESLVARLAAGYLVASEIRLELGFADGSRWREALRVPDPSGDVDLLFRVVHTRLEDVQAPSPVVLLGVALEPARAGRHQLQLFDSSLRDPNRFAETVARLEALCGAGRVGSPERLDTHRPDALVLRPFDETAASSPAQAAGDPRPVTAGAGSIAPACIGLPLRRFRPPVEAWVRCIGGAFAVPEAIRSAVVEGSIREVRGPWMYSGEWWEAPTRWSRIEWDIAMTAGGIYRLAWEQNRWTVDGVYG